MHDAIAKRDEALRRRILPVVDRFIAPSRFLRESFVHWGIPEDQIDYMRTGIDLAPFEGFERIPADHVRVGFIGTVVPHKGLHVLLRAWERLPSELRERHELRLHGPLAHDPSYLKAVREIAERLRVPLRGALRSEEVAGALREIDVLVVPSVWYENSPLIILEALATRTPLLVSDLGGMAELVEPGVSGERFRVGDAESLCSVLTGYLERPERLGQLYGQEFRVRSVEQDAERLEELYARGIERCGSTAP
jgi:glycosyltransferase involved in cell wall biosynthesis